MRRLFCHVGLALCLAGMDVLSLVGLAFSRPYFRLASWGYGLEEVLWGHSHGAADECTPECRAWNPYGWTCSRCHRQRPMAANTEEWAEPLCDECFLEHPAAGVLSGGEGT